MQFPDLLSAALRYAGEYGWPVFPLQHISHHGMCSCGDVRCSSPGKHPATKHGFHDATTDPDKINEWWSRLPAANIGIPTGATSGLLVVDIDGQAGIENFLALVKQENADSLETLTARTGGGGYHWLFQHPGLLVRNSAGELAAGLDIRCDGGYIVAPPSKHVSGLRYEWLNESPVAPLPAWLGERLVPGIHRNSLHTVMIVPQGQRNSALTSLAGKMRRIGMEKEGIEAALMKENEIRCDPPLPEREVAGIAASVGSYPLVDDVDGTPGNPARSKVSNSDLLVRIGGSAEMFHSPEGDCYATVQCDGHRETLSLTTSRFRNWITRLYYQETGKPPQAQALRDALGVFHGRAQYDGPEKAVHVRLAGGENTIYLDLGDPDWQVVEITAIGWRIVSDQSVKFRRPRGMKALPVPVRNGNLEHLRRFVNLACEEDWVLLVGFLLACFRPCGPYPVLVLHGEHGSAKSSLAKILRRLVDPNVAELRSEPREIRDLVVAASNGWIVAWDNISYLQPWLSDSLCRLATGGGFGTRELYSDAEEKLFQFQRPVILNGIEEIATRPDLLDRSVVLYLPHLSSGQRRPESEFWAEFESVAPGILGALLDAVASSMANIGSVKLEQLPRLADFAIWASAAEPGIGWPHGTFLSAYNGNRESANDFALDASPVTSAVRELINNGSWVGTATALLEELAQRAGAAANKSGWPKNGKSLSAHLRRLAPNLRAAGIEVEFWRSGARLINIRKIASPASVASKVSN